MNAIGAPILTTLRDGVRLWWLAPLLPLLAFGTELYQHYGEIHLGMFASREAFTALQGSAERMDYALWKILGVAIAMVGSAQYWPNRAAGLRWWSTDLFVWPRVVVSTVASIALAAGAFAIVRNLDGIMSLLALLVLFIAATPLMLYSTAACFGDDDWPLARAYREGWGTALRMAGLVLVVLVPLQVLHMANHFFAFGQPTAMLWAIMVFDSLIVSLIATLVGTAIFRGLRPESSATIVN